MGVCGWCWVVAGRKILAWPREASAAPAAPTAARELTLPQTDLAHKADLVMIFYEDDTQVNLFFFLEKLKYSLSDIFK